MEEHTSLAERREGAPVKSASGTSAASEGHHGRKDLPKLLALPAAPAPRGKFTPSDGFGSIWTFLVLCVVVAAGLSCLVAPKPKCLAGFACCLPPAFAGLTLLLINRRAQLDQLEPAFSKELDPKLTPFVERAKSIWLYERERSRSALARANVYAVLWGASASLSLIGATAFLLPPINAAVVLPDAMRSAVATNFSGTAQLIALTVIGAVATRFLIDLGSIAVRISNTDVTRRMFAEAVRGLIGSLLAATVLVMLLDVLNVQELKAAVTTRGAPAALGLGCAVAFIGAAAFDWLQVRLRVLFGMSEKVASGGTPLVMLDDIGEMELERLAEEGIRSVEALVATSVPRLFFGTKFSLQRIIGWHDRGLLLVRVGADASKELAVRWGIHGCLEVLRAYEGEAKFDALATLKAVFQKTLRVDNAKEAEMVLWQIARDDRVRLVQVMHHTLVEQAPPAE
jgi:hypothetical protein